MPASKFSGSSVATSPGRIPNASSFMGYLAEPTVGQPPPVLKTARGHGRWRLPTGGSCPPTCREPFYRIKISLYGLRQYAVRRIFARAPPIGKRPTMASSAHLVFDALHT